MAPRRRKLIKRVAAFALLGGIVGALVVLAMSGHVRDAYAIAKYQRIEDVPVSSEPRVAIVFGAGVWTNGEPSPVLQDRIATAVDLYRAGRVRKLLLTGDNRFADYNEPAVMRETALRMGVPEGDLVLDFAGRRTYDSCYRAHQIFGVADAVLVTQEFHLARALYLCNQLGVRSVGVAADRQSYGDRSRVWWRVRERLALGAAWLDINITRPTPVLGERELIVMTSNRQAR